MGETAFVDRGPIAKSPNSKRRLVEVLKLLYEQTDDEHGITLADIATHLEELDIFRTGDLRLERPFERCCEAWRNKWSRTSGLQQRC